MTVVATLKSESVAMVEVVKEVSLLRQMQHFVLPILRGLVYPHHGGQTRSDQVGHTPFSSKRTRHIDMKHQMVRDVVQQGEVNIIDVKTKEHHADVLTKAEYEDFQHARKCSDEY